MRLMVTAALTVALLGGCASTSMKGASALASAARDGSSLANAIVINAADESTGVAAEYKWIAERFPGYTRGQQALLNEGGRFYDEIDFSAASGEKKKIYFDISNFFGKM
ncbi:MAG: hypothetical protein ABI357_00855 [Granulicella sp.]